MHVWQRRILIRTSLADNIDARAFPPKPHYTRRADLARTPARQSDPMHLHFRAFRVDGVPDRRFFGKVRRRGIFPRPFDESRRSEDRVGRRETVRTRTKGWGRMSCMATPTNIHWLLLGDTLHGTLYLARSSRLLHERCWCIGIERE